MSNPLKTLLVHDLRPCIASGGVTALNYRDEAIYIPPRPFKDHRISQPKKPKDILSRASQYELERISRGESGLGLFEQNKLLAKSVLRLGQS